NAAPNSMAPVTTAHAPTQMVSAYAVIPGHARATAPAAASSTARRRWPATGPAVSLEKARVACQKPDAKAAMAKRITNAPIVMLGQAMAMMPMAMAKTPRQARDVV